MKKRIYFDLFVILLLSLLPLLWLHGNQVLLGHDAGIPFDPITHFLDRFSVWSQRLGIGTDQSFGLLGALPIHGLEAFLSWLGLSFHWEELVQFIFWFSLPGLAMYFFTRKTWPEKKYLPLMASVIYMINFYLLQGWFIAERTTFSIYSAIPFMAYFTFAYFFGKAKLLKSVLATALILSLLNGGGSFPLYGGLLLFWFLAAVFLNFIYPGFNSIKKTFAYFFGSLVFYILLSAYWFFPYVYYVLGFYSRDLSLAGGAEGALAWATYLARGTSFINLFRGQGVPEWYLNQYHAYAGAYLSNPWLILTSFLLPILAFLPLFLLRSKKDKLYIYFFSLLVLITLIFAAGPGSQLGIIYATLTKYLPGFAIFRSAYYKFDYTFFISYGVLIGFSLDWFFSKVEERLSGKKFLKVNFVTSCLLLLLIGGYLLYHFPYLSGSFLNYSHEPGKELTTRITVPQYVLDFGKWANSQDPNKRYLIAPELGPTYFIAYTWKYWSTAPINSLQTKNSFVQNTFLVPQDERLLMSQMYNALLRNDMKSFSDFAEVFAIDGIIVQEDFDWKNPTWGTTDPARYEEILNGSPNFKLVKTFDKWKVYDIVRREKSLRVTATARLSFLHGELNNIVSFPYFDPKSPLFIDNMAKQEDSDYFIKEATDVYLSPDCISCNLEPININFKYYNPKVLPGSFLYPIILYKENLVKKNAKTFNSYLNYLVTVLDRRIIESKWMIDSKMKIDHLEESLQAYHNLLIALNEFVSKKDWGVNSTQENIGAQTIAAHLEEEAILIESMYNNNLNNINTRSLLVSSYDELLNIYAIVKKRIWVTQNTKEKRYLFDLKRRASYDVYVKKDSLADPKDLINKEDLENLTVDMPSEGVTLKPTSEVSGWINFGNVDIKNKILKIELHDSTVRNLLEGVSPVLPADSTGIRSDRGVYTLNTDSLNKCFYFPLANLDTVNSQYIVSFTYRNLSDKINLAFLKLEPEVKHSTLSVNSEFLANKYNWTSNTDVQPREKYIIMPKSLNLNLYFCNGFVSLKDSIDKKQNPALFPGQDVIEIKDITVNKISIPSIVLYKANQNIETHDFVSSFKRPNSVEYKIKMDKVETPTTLVMRESYGKYWKICEDNRGCLGFEDKNHFASAGFENAWYFKDGIKGNIDLYYYPQRTYAIGSFITIIFYFLTIGGLWWLKIKRK